VITFTNVSKLYRGWRGRGVRALDDFSLELRQGEVFGLAGPNGAGKSTMISLLLGFLEPTSGTVTVDGLEPRRYVERNGLGYLSELVNVPPTWRVSQALRRYALLAGVPKDAIDQRIRDSIARLGLEEHEHKRVRQLSKGNLQRLGLAQALLVDERVLVLDEPTHGLDPVWTQRFRDIVASLRAPDRTILIASHNLDELERVADRVGIIDRGRLQRIVDMRTRSPGVEGTPYRLLVREGELHVRTRFPHAVVIGDGELEIAGVSLEELNQAVSSLIADGVRFIAVYPVQSALEQEFRDVVRRKADQ
jgi:ABC-type multidrug transport system ATPase subunit